MPFTESNTTTIAEAVRDVPLAQFGWQLFTFRVPMPCPPIFALHICQLMAVTVMAPVAHPTVSVEGRTVGVDPGPQDTTAGTGATVVVVLGADVAVVVDPCAVVVERPMRVDVVDGAEDLEPTADPMAIPTPRAARMSATMPALTTVLGRTVMTRERSSTTKENGSW